MTTIALLGAGAMGRRMAARWLQAGHQLVVYNRTPERAAPLVEQGARLAESPAAAAADAQLVIGMVTGDEASRVVWLDPDTGAAQALQPDAVAVASSTLTLRWVEQLGAEMARRGVSFLDAPVVGSRPQAETGALIYLVGGEAQPLERVRPVLEACARSVVHCGPVGGGTAIKLAVNASFGVQVALLAEMLGMLERAGISRSVASELLAPLPITSPAAVGVGKLMAAGEYAPMFPIDLVHKDFRYITEVAEQLGMSVPLTSAARSVYAAARQAGHGGDNIVGVAQLYA